MKNIKKKILEQLGCVRRIIQTIPVTIVPFWDVPGQGKIIWVIFSARGQILVCKERKNK